MQNLSEDLQNKMALAASDPVAINESDANLSWLLKSVDYGRHCERKGLNDSNTSSLSNMEGGMMQGDQNITDKLIKIQRLFNLFVTTSPDKDVEFRNIVKDEVERLIRESLALSFNL